MTDANDIRDLTKALKDNTKALKDNTKTTKRLEETLIEIERNRTKELSVQYCGECANYTCVPRADKPDDKNCVCCKVLHQPGVLVASIRG